MKHFIKNIAALTLSLLLLIGCACPISAATIDVTAFTTETVSDTEVKVTWADSADAVLKSVAKQNRTAEMTIDCSFTEAYVWYETGSQVVSSTLSSGKITFAIPGAGVYHIMSGKSPYRTVTFSTGSGSKVPTQTVKVGDTVVQPTAPSWDGHTFEGWYQDEGLTKLWNFQTDTVTDDLTLYAKWKEVPKEEPTKPTETTPEENTKPTETTPEETTKPTETTPEETTKPTEPPSSITKVEISPKKVTLKQGESQQFTATVSGTGEYDGDVVWTVSGNQDTTTTISATGKLTMGKNESAKKMTVTATSRQDTGKSASATVKLQSNVISNIKDWNPTTGDYIFLAAATAMISGSALGILLILYRRKKH